MIAPRLHVLPAVACDKALVLRRGPSGQVASLIWDRKSGEIKQGQWLKGRIYEHRADLSPDGRHMVYFAGNGRRWWTAVSRAPWLAALIFLPQDSTWHGGGAFTDQGALWLNGSDARDELLPDGLKPAAVDTFPHATDGFHMGDMYAAMQGLRGWVNNKGSGYDIVLQKPLWDGWYLEQTFVTGADQRSIVSPHYALFHPERDLRREMLHWEWVEPMGNALQFAQQGQLLEAGLTDDGGLADVRVIADFCNMTFEAVQAPYSGINAKDLQQ